jgi:hypothetical protein
MKYITVNNKMNKLIGACVLAVANFAVAGTASPPGAGTVGTGDIVWQDASGGSGAALQKSTGSAGPKVNFCVRVGVINPNTSITATTQPIAVKLRRSGYKSPVINAQIADGLGIGQSTMLSQLWCESGVPKSQLASFRLDLSGHDVKPDPAKPNEKRSTTRINYPCPVSPSADIAALAQLATHKAKFPGKFGCSGTAGGTGYGAQKE